MTLPAELRAEADVVYCARCEGRGSVYTGITESPTTICNACDGTGIADAPLPETPGD